LSRYIEEELNIRSIKVSSDEKACGVKWKVDADWPVLGRKLRKDMPRVKKALPSVTSEQVKAYLSTGKITVDGIELVAGDLTTARFVELPAAVETSDEVDAAQYSSDTDNDVVLLMDIKVRPDFVKEAFAREIVNRIQRSRKRAGCQATDDMEIYVAFQDEEGQQLLGGVLADKADVFSRVMKRVPQDDRQRDTSRPVYFQDPEEHEVGGSRFNLVLLEAGK